MELLNLIQEQLLKSADITSVIANRLYIGEMATLKGVQFPCINIELNPGALIEKLPGYAEHYFRMWVWGKTRDSSDGVYGAVMSEYHNMTITADDLSVRANINEVSRPIYNYDPTVESYFLMARWRAFLITI